MISWLGFQVVTHESCYKVGLFSCSFCAHQRPKINSIVFTRHCNEFGGPSEDPISFLWTNFLLRVALVFDYAQTQEEKEDEVSADSFRPFSGLPTGPLSLPADTICSPALPTTSPSMSPPFFVLWCCLLTPFCLTKSVLISHSFEKRPLLPPLSCHYLPEICPKKNFLRVIWTLNQLKTFFVDSHQSHLAPCVSFVAPTFADIFRNE